jgi:hypothetical protein
MASVLYSSILSTSFKWLSVTGWPQFDFQLGQGLLILPLCPDQVTSQSSVMHSGYQEAPLLGKKGVAVNELRREADHWPSSTTAKIKNEWRMERYLHSSI